MNRGADSCAEVDARLLDYAYGELEGAERAGFEEHLERCSRCREELGAIAGTRRLMQVLEPEPAPEAGLESLLDYANRAARRQSEAGPRRRWQWLVPAFSAGGLALALVFVLVAQESPPEAVFPLEGAVGRAAPSVEEVGVVGGEGAVAQETLREQETAPGFGRVAPLEQAEPKGTADLDALAEVPARRRESKQERRGTVSTAKAATAPAVQEKKKEQKSDAPRPPPPAPKPAAPASRSFDGRAGLLGGVGTGAASSLGEDDRRAGGGTAAKDLLDGFAGLAAPRQPAPSVESARVPAPTSAAAGPVADRIVGDSDDVSAEYAPAEVDKAEDKAAPEPEPAVAAEPAAREDAEAPRVAKKRSERTASRAPAAAVEEREGALARAQSASASGDHAGAARLLERFLASIAVEDPRAPEALLMLGREFESSGQPRAAQAAYARFLALYPSHPSAQVAVSGGARLQSAPGAPADVGQAGQGGRGAGWPNAAPANIQRSKAAPARSFDEIEGEPRSE